MTDPVTGQARNRRLKILVLGDDTRSFLAVVRSLGRRGMEVHAAPTDFLAVALRSRYLHRCHFVPLWMGDGAEWLAAMTSLLQAERFDMVVPCNETSLLPLHRHRLALGALAILGLPDEASMEILFDKHLTRELAREAGVPVAPGRLPRATDTVAGLVSEFALPVVVKPRRSYSLEQMYPRGKVRLAANAAELARLLPGLDPARDLLEKFLPGSGVGLSVLAHRGRVLQAFEHRRVRETLAGGYYRVSVALDPGRMAAVAAMVAKLGYTGVAMFEFRVRDDGGGWILLEVNARPWGSLPLPLAAGVDFAGAWVELLVNGVEEPRVSYRPGIYARNFLPDLQVVLAEAARVARSPARLARFAGGQAREALRVLTGREHQDTLVLDDPRPGLWEVWALARNASARLGRRLPGRRRLLQALAGRAVARAAASPARTVTFVCDGNICRSPYAAIALRRGLRGLSESYRVNSAGMAPRPGRASPGLAVEAAREAGLDLSHHRSRYLTRELAEAASLLIVFEPANRHAILSRYPDLATPIVLLGELDPGTDAPAVIADPVDGDLAVFTRTYRRIDRALTHLGSLLGGAPTAVSRPPGRPDRSTR